MAKRTPKGTGYVCRVGLDYPPNVRREAGDIADDIPPQSIPWLLAKHMIYPVGEPEPELAPRQMAPDADTGDTGAVSAPAPTEAAPEPELSPDEAFTAMVQLGQEIENDAVQESEGS